MVTEHVLREFGLFKGVDEVQLEKIAKLCHQRTLPEGTICFAQSSRATDLHLCLSGKVDIIVQLPKPWDREVTIHSAQKGEVFGWSALTEPPIYTASARCRETTQGISIKGADLLVLFDHEPRLSYIIMRNLTAIIGSRLREMSQRISAEVASAVHEAISDVFE